MRNDGFTHYYGRHKKSVLQPSVLQPEKLQVRISGDPKPSRQKTEVELLISKVYEDAQNDLRNEILRRANVRK